MFGEFALPPRTLETDVDYAPHSFWILNQNDHKNNQSVLVSPNYIVEQPISHVNFDVFFGICAM